MRMVSIHAPPPPTLSWARRLACILSWASIPIPRPNSTLLPLVKFPPLLLPLPCFPCFAIARFVSDSELHRAPPSPALRSTPRRRDWATRSTSFSLQASPTTNKGTAPSRTNKGHRRKAPRANKDQQKKKKKRRRPTRPRPQKRKKKASPTSKSKSPLQQAQMPTMSAWLSAIFQRSRTDDDDPVDAPLVVPARKKHRGFQSYMYARRRPSDAELARNQEAADRILPPGPTIDEHLQKDAEITDPYEQEKFHIDYLTIRSASKYGWDTCAACYFQDPNSIVDTKTGKLEKHFNNKHHEDEKPKRCKVCDALFHSQRLKWHIKFCHPGHCSRDLKQVSS